MCPIEEVIRAATFLSSSIPKLPQDLLPGHREKLQSALDSLEDILRPICQANNAVQQQNCLQHPENSQPILAQNLPSPFCLSQKDTFQQADTQTSHEVSQIIPLFSLSQSLPESRAPDDPACENTAGGMEIAVPENAVPESAVPESAVPESAVPESAVPESAVPESAVPESAVPGGAIQESTVREGIVLRSCPPDDANPAPESPVQENLKQGNFLSKIMSQLNAKAKSLQAFTSRPPKTAVLLGKNWTTMDPLEVDFKLSTPNCSMTDRFRGILCRYIFAEGYLCWAVDTYSSPRQTFLTKFSESNNASNPVVKYLRHIRRDNLSNRRAVHQGIRLHSLSHLYGCVGVLAFIFDVNRLLRDLKNVSLKPLAKLIHESPILCKLATEREQWFNDCLRLYLDDIVDYRKRNQGAKRSLDSDELHLGPNKRAEVNHTPEAQDSDINITGEATVSGSNTSLPVASQTFQDPNLQAFEVDFDPFGSDFAFYLHELSGDFLSSGRDNFNSQDGGTEFPTSETPIIQNPCGIIV